jgi:hypothetical protein
MKRAILVLGVLTAALLAKPAGAFDQNAAQAACGNDVFALCQQYIPDHTRIAACLRAQQSKVSPTCRAFMAKSASEMKRTAKHQSETVGSAPSE